ncbi:hypothetical protein EDD11_009394, partial [Mortierella claussenii]
MSAEQKEDKLSQLWTAYSRVIYGSFHEQYKEKWEEEAYWEAVETFKVESREIGYEGPFEELGQYGHTSYEVIRNKLMAGPKPCFRKGWKSPYTGEKVD